MPFDLNSLQMMTMMGNGGFGGLDPMMTMAAGGPQGLPHINATNYMTGYEERSAIRQALRPQVRGSGRIARSISGAIGGVPSIGGGMDASSMTNPGVANAALSPYGLQLPTHTNPFLFFQDQNQDGSPTWAGNHPKVAKAIEGAMIGAANTGQGQTIGENISNVARSVLSIPGMYKNSQAAQMQAPFDMAAQINGLQMDHANMEEKLATAFHLRATGLAAMDKPTKAYSGQVYQDANNRPYQVNQVDGTPQALDGRSEPLQLSGSTKVGAPAKPNTATALPKGINPGSPAGKAWIKYTQEPGYDANRFPDDWGKRVDAETSKTAAAGGYGRNAGNQGSGAISDTDKQKLDSLKKERDDSFRLYNEADKLTPNQVRGRAEGTYSERKAAEKAERKAAYDKAQSALDDANNQVSQGVSSGGNRIKPQGSSAPLKVKIGNITIERK